MELKRDKLPAADSYAAGCRSVSIIPLYRSSESEQKHRVGTDSSWIVKIIFISIDLLIVLMIGQLNQ